MTKAHRDAIHAISQSTDDLNELFDKLQDYQEKHNLFNDPHEAAYDLCDYYDDYTDEPNYGPAYVPPVETAETATL